MIMHRYQIKFVTVSSLGFGGNLPHNLNLCDLVSLQLWRSSRPTTSEFTIEQLHQ